MLVATWGTAGRGALVSECAPAGDSRRPRLSGLEKRAGRPARCPQEGREERKALEKGRLWKGSIILPPPTPPGSNAFLGRAGFRIARFRLVWTGRILRWWRWRNGLCRFRLAGGEGGGGSG